MFAMCREIEKYFNMIHVVTMLVFMGREHENNNFSNKKIYRKKIAENKRKSAPIVLTKRVENVHIFVSYIHIVVKVVTPDDLHFVNNWSLCL